MENREKSLDELISKEKSGNLRVNKVLLFGKCIEAPGLTQGAHNCNFW